MQARIGVLIVHGMGNQPATFADGLIDETRRRLRDEGVDPATVAFRPAHWGPVLESRESELYRKLSQDNDLDWAKMRRDIIVSGIGDGLAYQGPATTVSTVYPKVHATFAEALSALEAEFDDGDHTPLVVMAHSLGCTMISDYIWDAQHERYAQGADTPFTRGETLSGLVTFGCNIPLFTLALPLTEVKPIRLPGAKAAQCFPHTTATQRKAALKWLNFYDPDDILGYPLRPINPKYAKAVSQDIAIDTGTILGAHTGYWTDNNFTKPVTRYLTKILELLPASS